MRANPHLLLMLTAMETGAFFRHLRHRGLYLAALPPILCERLHLFHLAGITLIFAGVLLVSRDRTREARG